MFQNKNQSSDPTGGKTILSQANDLPIEDIPIHSLKKDLEEIKHPELAKSEVETPATILSREKLSATQKTSPFLDFAPEKGAPSGGFTAPKNTPADSHDSRIAFSETKPELKMNEKENIPTDEKKPATHINYGRVFTLIIIFLIVAILAGGGYYFWSTRQKPAEVSVTPQPILEQTPEPQAPAAPTFTTDKPNILAIDMTATDTASVKETLQKYAADVAASKSEVPVEFTPVDAASNPITFQNFAKKANLLFSPALSSNLDKTFSLFIYNDGDVTRLGLAIDSKNPTRLKALMLAEEKNLIKELEPLFLATDYTLTAKTYGNTLYKDLSVRYANIISPEDLSVDYAISGQKLLVGTTEMTLRSIIDKEIAPSTITETAPETNKETATTTPTATNTPTEKNASETPAN